MRKLVAVLLVMFLVGCQPSQKKDSGFSTFSDAIESGNPNVVLIDIVDVNTLWIEISLEYREYDSYDDEIELLEIFLDSDEFKSYYSEHWMGLDVLVNIFETDDEVTLITSVAYEYSENPVTLGERLSVEEPVIG